MSGLSRRQFVKITGGAIAALGAGMSIPDMSWAKAEGVQSQKASGNKWADWEFYYPGKYDEEDSKIVKEFMANCKAVEDKGEVNISDLISGKHEGDVGVGRSKKVTLSSMQAIAKANVSNNPLFMDREYAKKTKYGDLFAFPMISTPEVMPAMFKNRGFADYMVVTSHNDSNSYYRPIYEGDTLYQIVDYQRSWDITPAEGSYYRTFVMNGRIRIFNQKGELVSEGANVLKETFRRHKDKEKRNIDGAHAWESPDWWTRPNYQYTDKDWEKIIGMWKNEKVRGAETLYWDEVKVGDMLTPKVVGPLLLNVEADMAGSVPQFAIDLKKNILDPKTFAKMKKNKFGIWVLPEYLEKKSGHVKAADGPQGDEQDAPQGGGADSRSSDGLKRVGFEETKRGWSPSEPDGAIIATKEVANRDGRAVFQNSVVAKLTGGMICDWMGDDGWLQRIGWDIMDIPPGSDKSINFQAYPTEIPSIPREYYPDLFDKFPYMEKVPFMKDKRANYHVLENDLVICNACVTSKYQKGGECFVDLTWWNTTIDDYIVQEGFATVKLPKKS